MAMKFEGLRRVLAADLYRYDGAGGAVGFVTGFVREAGFRYTALLRTCRVLRSHVATRWLMYPFFSFWLSRLSSKLGVHIDITTQIGPGFYMAHPLGIIINRRCVIGANCNIGQHVTLGIKSREPDKGCPVIGDEVFIGPGAVVFGAIVIGSCSAVGANCVVTRSVAASSVVVGVPGKVISSRGSEGYINYVKR